VGDQLDHVDVLARELDHILGNMLFLAVFGKNLQVNLAYAKGGTPRWRFSPPGHGPDDLAWVRAVVLLSTNAAGCEVSG
jgi:hypothetical protein